MAPPGGDNLQHGFSQGGYVVMFTFSLPVVKDIRNRGKFVSKSKLKRLKKIFLKGSMVRFLRSVAEDIL